VFFLKLFEYRDLAKFLLYVQGFIILLFDRFERCSIFEQHFGTIHPQRTSSYYLKSFTQVLEEDTH